MYVVPQERQDRHPIGVAINQRRRGLGLRWKDIYQASGLSQETVRQIRNGRTPSRITDSEARLEDALRWQRGSIQAIRDGREPTPLAGTPGAPAAYPDWVGDNQFFRHIYDYAGPDADEQDKRVAIRAVVFAREDYAAYKERGA